MPFILSKVSTPISAEQEVSLKKGLGKAISIIPGKSEEYLLCEFEDNSRLWLRGEHDEPIAYITVSIFGNEPHIGNDRFFSEVTRLYGEVLGIPADRVYIKYDDISVWGVNGMAIDRRAWR